MPNDPIVSTDLSTSPTITDPPIVPSVNPVDIPTLYKAGFDASTQKATLATLLNSMKVPAQEHAYIDPVLTPQPLTKRYATYSPFVDNEELAAERQPFYNKWSNAMLKMGATALGTFAEGFMTFPDTIAAIKSGKISDLYQSDFETGVDKWLKNLEDEFPNYYSKWEKEHPFASALPFSGGFTNFWADKILKNLGFTVGAIGSAVAQDFIVGAATDGIGAVPLLSSQLGRASLYLSKLFTGTDRVTDLLKTAEAAGRTGKQLFDLEKLARLSAAAQVGTSARYGLNLYSAARTEAAIEARDGYQQIKDDLTQEFIRTQGYEPTGGDLQRIEAYATAGGNTRMGINMALLTLSDAIQFDNILKPFSAGRNQYKSTLTSTIEKSRTQIGLAEGSRDTFQQFTPAITGTGGKIWNAIKPQVPNILSEGILEEGGQFAAEAGTKHYYEELYKGNHAGTLSDVINSTFKGLSDQFGTTEGLENMLLGAITGVIFGGFKALKDKGLREQETQTVLTLLNSSSLSGLIQDVYGAAAKSSQIKQDMEKAVAENNIFRFKNLQSDLFVNFIHSGIKAGKFDVRLEQLNMMRDLTPDEFKKAFGLDKADSNLPVSSYIDMLIGKANEIKKSYDAIDKTYTNPYRKYSKPKDEQQITESLKADNFDQWKASLLYYTGTVSDANSRIISIGSDISNIHPSLTGTQIENLSTPEYYRTIRREYELETRRMEQENASDLISKETRRDNRKIINSLNKKIELIDNLLNSSEDELPNNLVETFDDILHYEINGDSDERAIEVRKESLIDLLQYGNDIRKLKERKSQANKAYDILTTEKGFNKYMDSLLKKQESRTLPQTPDAFSRTSDQEVNPSDDRSFTLPLIDKTTRTFTIGQEFNKSVPSHKGPKTITILGQTEDGKVIIETGTGDRREVSPDYIATYYERTKTPQELAAEELAALLQKQAEFQASQQALQQQSGTTSTNENDTDIASSEKEPKKKATSILFFSTAESSEEWDKNPTPMTNRRRAFLNNAKNSPNRPTMRMLLGTRNQEASLNLTGLTDILLQNAPDDVKNAPSDVDTGVVYAVYINHTPKGDYYVDVNGNNISKVGEPVDLNRVVASVMPSTSLTWSDGSPRYREKEEENAKAYQKTWRNKRSQLFSMAPGQYETYDFSISRGLGLVNPIDQSGERERNPVSPTLIPKSRIGDAGLIVISDTGTIAHEGQNLKFPVGRPILQYADTLEFLNNRNLTSNEQAIVYDLLVELAKRAVNTNKLDKSIVSFLQGILYWGQPNTVNGPKDPGRNQIYVDSSFNLVSGDGNLNIPFTPTSIEQNSQAVRRYLEGVYNNVNKYKIEKMNGEPFTQILNVNSDGSLDTITWKSYQHYLISPTYDLVENDKSSLKGTTRKVNDIPLYTSVRKKNPNVENDYNFSQKYAIIQGIELPVSAKPTAPEVAVPDVAALQAQIDQLNAPTSAAPTASNSAVFTTVQGENITYNYNITEGKRNVVSLQDSPQLNTVLQRFITSNVAPDIGTARSTLIKAIQSRVADIEESKPAPPPPPVQPSETNLDTPDISAPTLDNPEYSRVTDFGVERMTAKDIAEAEKFRKENVPNIPMQELETIITIAPNEFAWGVFEEGVAKFYKEGKRGTQYHELFEGIWKGFLTPNEQNAILEEYRAKGVKGNDRDIKEKIADDFADFRLGKQKARNLSDLVRKFFRAIINFFRSFVSKPSLKTELFKKISKGGYRDAVLPQTIYQEQSEYSRVAPYTETQTHELVQDITARVFQILFKDNKSLFNIEQITDNQLFNEVKLAYTSKNPIPDEVWNALVAKTKDFLRTFKIEFDEDNNVTINDEQSDRTEYAPQPFTVDFKKSSPYAIKLLGGTMIQTQPTSQVSNILELPKPKPSSIGGYQLVNFSKLFVGLLDKLANSTDLNSMITKLVNTAQDNPDYVRLFTRLKGNRSTKQIDYSQLSPHDWRLLINFFSVFNKQKPTAFIQYVKDGTNVFTNPANTQTIAAKTRDGWVDNMKALSEKKGSPITYLRQSKTYSVDKEYIKGQSIRTPEDMSDFLDKLGINFPTEVYNILSKNDKNKFATSVGSIKTFLQKKGELVTLSGNTLGITAPLNILAGLFTRATTPQTDSTYFNVEQKKTQIFTDNNALSFFENRFNGASTRDEVLRALPHLSDVFSRNSRVLRRGGLFFDEEGNRRRDIKVSYIQGTFNEDSGDGTTTADLTYGNRVIQEFNQNLQGEYFVLVPADSQTEWMMNLGNSISYESFSNNLVWNTIYSTFDGYLEDEIQLALSDRSHLRNVGNKSHRLRFMKEILPADMVSTIEALIEDGNLIGIDEYRGANTEAINAAINQYITSEVEDVIKVLGETGQLVRIDGGKFSISRLDSSFAGRKDVQIDKFDMTAADVRNLVLFATTNYVINNIEYHKILFGDPYQFAVKGNALDETKRIKSFESPRRTTFDTPEFNNFANDHYNKVGGISITEGVPGYHQFKSYANTFTTADVNIVGSPSLSDSIPQDIRKAYENTNEADASSWIMDATYREVKLKNGQWSEELSEPWYQYQMAYTRDKLNKKGVFPNSDYPSVLREHDKKLLSKGKPQGFAVEVLKPIVSGIKYGATDIDLILDKFSQLPMFYSFVEGTNLEDTYIKMWKEKMDYFIMISGRKVGAETLYSLYNEDGSLNTEPFPTPIKVGWDTYGIQVENSYEGGKQQTRGSQLTKEATLDMMNAGKPIDTKLSDEEWSSMSEEAKENASPMYQKIKRNQRILDQLTEEGYQTLLSRLGIQENNDAFVLTDRSLAADTLRQEMFRRELSDNAKESITINPETGDFFIPFEASTHYVQIRNILYSIVDKSLLSPKMNGGPKVQVSSTLFEKGNREAVYRPKGDPKAPYKKVTSFEDLSEKEKSTVRLTSSLLKFYTPEDPYCEVLLPHWFGEKFKKLGLSDAKIIDYLNNSDEGKQILTGIGFRIPTQGMNSVEVFRVKGFLPQDMGSSIVVPSEITTKAGSDFDIDKLNTYLKNIYLDKKGKIKLVTYQGSKEATLEHYGKIYDEIFENKKVKKSELLEAAQILNYGLDDPKGLVDRYSAVLDSLLENTDDPTDVENSIMKELERMGNDTLQTYIRDRYINDMYKKSLENEYFNSLEELLTQPEMFNRLINPTSEGELKTIAGELDKLRGADEGAIRNRLLNRRYMSFTRHAFLTGKRWVGIGAVNITGHSLMQRSPVYMDVRRANEQDAQWLGDGSILLPHNTVTIENREYPSLSGITDQEGVYISDKLSAYITAFVDVAKDPFILKIVSSNAVVSTFLFLERIGVPTRTAALFMNQPAVLTYLKQSGSTGFLSFSNKVMQDVYKMFPSAQDSTAIDLGSFSGTIEKYYKNPSSLIAEENAQQRLILSEFLKYSKMADNVFKVTQATNYDTASFRSGFDIARKQLRTQVANRNNIVISASDILSNSFIGKTAESLDKSRDALGTLLKLEQFPISGIIDRVMFPYSSNNYLGNDNFQRIALNVVTSFIDYAVQTDTKVNNRITDLMVNLETSVANQLATAKEKFPNNQLLRDLRVNMAPQQDGTKGVSMFVNIRDAYDENLYTGMFRELRDNPETRDLYFNLIRVALLQGTAVSPISFTNLIPIEDYATVVTPVINKLVNTPDLHTFADNVSFQRNNWRDNNIVPTVTPKFFTRKDEYGDDVYFMDDVTGDEFYFFYSYQFPELAALGIKSEDRKILLLPTQYNQRYLGYPVLKTKRMIRDNSTGVDIDIFTGTTITPRMKALALQRGDYSFWEHIGYKQVQHQDGTPLTYVDDKGNKSYVYKQINLHGDSFRLKEYYKDGRPSAVPNGTIKIEKEFSDSLIVAAYGGNDTGGPRDPVTPVPAPETPVDLPPLDVPQDEITDVLNKKDQGCQ